MLITVPKGSQAISLEQLLMAREARVDRQRALVAQYQLPLISLTLVMPGTVKQSSSATFLFDEAMLAVLSLFDPVICEIRRMLSTGPEGFFVICADLITIKKQCIELENRHFIGRFWDLDVICPDTMVAISRSQLGYDERRCLLCQQSAKICARQQTHNVLHILYRIECAIARYITGES